MQQFKYFLCIGEYQTILQILWWDLSDLERRISLPLRKGSLADTGCIWVPRQCAWNAPWYQSIHNCSQTKGSRTCAFTWQKSNIYSKNMQKQSLQRAFTWHVFRILGHRIVKSSVTSEVVASCYFWHHSIRIAKDTSTKNAIVVSRFKPPNNNLLDTTKAIGWFCLGGSKAQIQNSKTPLQSMQLHLQVSGHISQKQFHSKIGIWAALTSCIPSVSSRNTVSLCVCHPAVQPSSTAEAPTKASNPGYHRIPGYSPSSVS